MKFWRASRSAARDRRDPCASSAAGDARCGGRLSRRRRRGQARAVRLRCRGVLQLECGLKRNGGLGSYEAAAPRGANIVMSCYADGQQRILSHRGIIRLQQHTPTFRRQLHVLFQECGQPRNVRRRPVEICAALGGLLILGDGRGGHGRAQLAVAEDAPWPARWPAGRMGGVQGQPVHEFLPRCPVSMPAAE
jgi:hypothetical protein